MTLTVVVDGGGSGSRFAAYDVNGTRLATVASGPASLSLGEAQAWSNISRGLQSLAGQLGENRNGTSITEIQTWSTCTRSTALASLAPLIVTAANQGDAVASALPDAGAAQCERLLSLAADALPVFVVGGLANSYRSRLSLPLTDRLREPQGDVLSGLFAHTCACRNPL